MTHQAGGGGWWPVSEWEFREAVGRVRTVLEGPKPHVPHMESIALDYGVSVRTLYRWARYDVRSVRCGKYEALFVIGKNRPSQVTPWEKAA